MPTGIGQVREYASRLAEEQCRQLEVLVGLPATSARVQHLTGTTSVAQPKRLFKQQTRTTAHTTHAQA
jgi:hypothetical protein